MSSPAPHAKCGKLSITGVIYTRKADGLLNDAVVRRVVYIACMIIIIPSPIYYRVMVWIYSETRRPCKWTHLGNIPHPAQSIVHGLSLAVHRTSGTYSSLLLWQPSHSGKAKFGGYPLPTACANNIMHGLWVNEYSAWNKGESSPIYSGRNKHNLSEFHMTCTVEK